MIDLSGLRAKQDPVENELVPFRCSIAAFAGYLPQGIGRSFPLIATLAPYLTSVSVAHLLRDHIETISPLSDEEFDYILSHYIVKKVRKHAFLIQEGDYVKHEYFVLKGCLKAFVTAPETDKDFIFQFAVEDWWITDREAFFTQSKASISVDCLEDCELLGITLENRTKLAAEMHKYEHFLAVKSTWGYISLQKRLQLMIMGSAKERYEKFALQYPHLIHRIPKSYIASYLGVSRETLSRLSRS